MIKDRIKELNKYLEDEKPYLENILFDIYCCTMTKRNQITYYFDKDDDKEKIKKFLKKNGFEIKSANYYENEFLYVSWQ